MRIHVRIEKFLLFNAGQIVSFTLVCRDWFSQFYFHFQSKRDIFHTVTASYDLCAVEALCVMRYTNRQSS